MIKIAGENPDVRAAGGNLGKAALTITKTINNALLPLAAVNFAFDKARSYFENRFSSDLEEKAAGIPREQLREPKASIAGPALQGLAFAHEEPDLKNMYLHLLSSAMDARVASRAHPAFVEILRQLDSEEARLLKGVLRNADYISLVEVRLQTPDQSGWNVLRRHVLNLVNGETSAPVQIPRLPAIVDNWIRLGLVEVDYSKEIVGTEAYSWVEARPEIAQLRTEHEKQRVIAHRGVLQRTNLGEQFAAVVGIIDMPDVVQNTKANS